MARSKPRRILLLVTDLEIGGTPTVVRELAIRLNGPAAQIEVACLSRWGPVADQIRAAGVTVHSLDAASPFELIGCTRRLMSLARQRCYDTIFSFLVHANAIAAITSRFLRGVRFIQSIQTTQPSPRWHWAIQSIAHNAAAQVVVPSPSVARAAMQWSHVPGRKILVIPNAIDPHDFSDVRQRASPLQIGFIGRLDPIKRVPLLVRTMSSLPHDVHLHIFGDGADAPLIESEIQRAELSNRVTLYGRVHRPHEALQRIGMLVLPSLAEGFPLVLIEAMAAGVPIVANDAPGIRDVVQHEQTALLVRRDEFGAAITRMISDNSLRARLVENARNDVRRFTWSSVIPMYQRLLGI